MRKSVVDELEDCVGVMQRQADWSDEAAVRWIALVFTASWPLCARMKLAWRIATNR